MSFRTLRPSPLFLSLLNRYDLKNPFHQKNPVKPSEARIFKKPLYIEPCPCAGVLALGKGEKKPFKESGKAFRAVIIEDNEPSSELKDPEYLA